MTQGVTCHRYDEPVVIYSLGEPTFYPNIPPRLGDMYIFCLFLRLCCVERAGLGLKGKGSSTEPELWLTEPTDK